MFFAVIFFYCPLGYSLIQENNFSGFVMITIKMKNKIKRE